jgi:acyl-CoA synthetase (AMP-forming)/AMP-acid ligase II
MLGQPANAASQLRAVLPAELADKLDGIRVRHVYVRRSMPLDEQGTRVNLVIITPRDPSSPPNLDDLRAFARQRLSRHKVPRMFEIRSSLPRTSSGKVIREGLQCA